MKLSHFVLAVLLSLSSACPEARYERAFAQNVDGTVFENEICRQSLAKSLFDNANREKTAREGSSNIFVFRGTLERYRVHAFNTQNECETALTGLVTRRSITPC
jgi:hypothetical protein